MIEEEERIPLASLDPIGRPITAEELRRNCGYPEKGPVVPETPKTWRDHRHYTIDELMANLEGLVGRLW